MFSLLVVLSAVSAGDRTATQLHSRHVRGRPVSLWGAPLCVSPVAVGEVVVFFTPGIRRFLVGADGPGTSFTNRSNDIARKHEKLFSENRTSPLRQPEMGVCLSAVGHVDRDGRGGTVGHAPALLRGEHPAGPTGGVLSVGTGGRRRVVPRKHVP